MDGLMVDTEPFYQVTWQQAASQLGYELTDELYARFVGRTNEVCEQILLQHFGSGFPLAAFRDSWPGSWRNHVEQSGVPLKPGLLEFLALVDSHQLPAAVATSSDADYAAFTLQQAGLTTRFKAIVSGDQVARSKPAPDIYLEAARRLGVDAAECVALEDSEAGILAIAEAGMVGILVPHWPASPTAIQAAFRVVDTLHEARTTLESVLQGGTSAARGARPDQ
jgi:HAD superfamily hydrolase (TIGR01509 family)